MTHIYCIYIQQDLKNKKRYGSMCCLFLGQLLTGLVTKTCPMQNAEAQPRRMVSANLQKQYILPQQWQYQYRSNCAKIQKKKTPHTMRDNERKETNEERD